MQKIVRDAIEEARTALERASKQLHDAYEMTIPPDGVDEDELLEAIKLTEKAIGKLEDSQATPLIPFQPPAPGLVACAYCGAAVPKNEAIPGATDDSGWRALAKIHMANCEWIATRAHRINA